jgi:hypothetical protein
LNRIRVLECAIKLKLKKHNTLNLSNLLRKSLIFVNFLFKFVPNRCNFRAIQGVEMKFHQAAFAAILAAVSFASAGARATVLITEIVQATTPFGSWLSTGLDLNSTTTYGFTLLDPSTIWSAGSNSPYSRGSTANGIPPSGGYGVWTMDGFTANYGALVGDAGSQLFLIGTGPIILKGLSGPLTVGYWDSYYPDNSGSQTLKIGTVPEISTWAMMLAGFASLGFAGYRLSRNEGKIAA